MPEVDCSLWDEEGGKWFILNMQCDDELGLLNHWGLSIDTKKYGWKTRRE